MNDLVAGQTIAKRSERLEKVMTSLLLLRAMESSLENFHPFSIRLKRSPRDFPMWGAKLFTVPMGHMT
jgi:hypothetical protein